MTGEYTIRTTLYYEDGTIEDIDANILIDPKGYVYTQTPKGEIRIKDAKITIFKLNPETEEYEIWQGQDYDQKNPQITNKAGEYEFLVPEGRYYITVLAKGYKEYRSGEFEVQEGDAINIDIQLFPITKTALLQNILSSVIIILGIGLIILIIRFKIWKKKKTERGSME